MNDSLPLLFIGLILGALLGWLARASRGTAPTDTVATALADAAPALTAAQRQAVTDSVAPLEKAMDRLGAQLLELEMGRTSELSRLGAHIHSMTRTSARLNERTEKLVSALRSPNVRGRWGEMQLERVVELGGMVKHVDFEPQETAVLDGARVRPDLIVNLAGGRKIVVDAKVPFSSYLDALEATDPEEHLGFLRRHAHLMRSHVTALSRKDYTAAFSPTPEFVILFVPADPFLDAALSADPELLEYAFSRDIVIATPTTLFALLRTVALSWQEADLSDKAREIQRLGRELYGRLGTMSEHYNKLGRNLERAVESFNAAMNSVDTRVMVTARRLHEMDIPGTAEDCPPGVEYLHSWPRRAR